MAGMQPMRYLAMPVIIVLVSLLPACAVREQAFDCIKIEQQDNSDELLMTPTSLRFQSQAYRFVEEQGAVRIYENASDQKRIEFNVASGVLRISQNTWRCKKFTL